MTSIGNCWYNQSGSYKAPSGLSYFFTNVGDGANTTKLFWQDETDAEKQKTKAANNDTCDICEKENVVQEDLYQLSDASNHSIVLPGLLCENKRARFTFDDTNLGYIYVVDNDGGDRDGWLHIVGQAQITENAICGDKDYSDVLWDVDVWFRPSEEGEAEAKFELEGQDDSDWRYWMLMSGGMFNKANPDEQISFVKMDNDYGLQVGTTANGKNLNFGASTWFNYTAQLDGQGLYSSVQGGHGDINIDLEDACDDDGGGDDDCNNYDLFYADAQPGNDTRSIFGVDISSGTDAVLSLVAERDYGFHLSYDTDKNILYASDSGGGFIEKIDPLTGVSLGFISLEGLNTIRCNEYKDGKIYLGSDNQNRIVEVDPADGSYTDVATDVPVSGGDLVFRNGDLYLATRQGNKLLLISGGSSSVVGNIPAGVNGLTLTGANELFMANFNSTAFNLIDATGAVTNTFDVVLEGESYTLKDGDLAGGCNRRNDTDEDPEVCENFDYFAADKKDGDDIRIYGVTINGGDAEMSELFSREVGISIAFDEDENVIYGVKPDGKSIEVIDPMSGASQEMIAIDNGLSGIFAAVFHNDKLYLGSGTQDKIYEVSLDGSYTTIASGLDIQGGDLVYRNNDLYLFTKDGDQLFRIAGGVAIPVNSIPKDINGAGITPDNNFVMVGSGSDQLFLINENGVDLGSFNLTLDGDAFTFSNGDFASGCNNKEIIDEIPVCENFDLFYGDHNNGVPGGRLFGVDLSGSDANISLIASRDYKFHISYDGANNVIYAVNGNGSFIEKMNADGSTIEMIPLEGLSQTYGNVFYEDFIYLASANQNRIVKVDPADGSYSVVATGLPVEGGDIVFRNGELYLATREGDKLFMITGGAAVEVSSIPADVNGMSVTAENNLLIANDGSNAFFLLDETGMQIASYDVKLDGEPFGLADGDLAGGCNTKEDGDGTPPDGCYAEAWTDFSQGLDKNGNPVKEDRSNKDAALGEPDRNNDPGGFYSLGFGGTLTLRFAGAVYDTPDAADIKVWETTFTGDMCGSSSDETALIELSQNGTDFVSVGIFCRDAEVDIAGSGLLYVTHIRITDNNTSTNDGYDVDGVEALFGCQEIPDNDGDLCYGSFVVDGSYLPGPMKNGMPITNPDRNDPTKALGEPQNDDTLNFVSLGYQW